MRAGALALIAALAGACAGDDDSVVCGVGTLEQGGACVALGPPVDESTCGPSTHYDTLAAACVPDAPPTVCGYCTLANEAPDGTVQCECGREPGELCGFCGLPCAQPAPGSAAVCGNLVDLATGDVLDPYGTGTPCDPDNPTASGACALAVRYYDALELAADPMGATALQAAAIDHNDCGGFRAIDLEVPFSGVVAIVVDDATGDEHVPSVTHVAVTAGQRRRDVIAGVVSRATDAAWTTSAQDPFGGDSFAARGAVFTRFSRAGTRVAGVELTCDGAPCADAFYFADTDPWTATAIDPDATSTAANGAALHTPAGLAPRGARGGLPDDCEWPAPAAASLVGFIAYQELAAQRSGDPTAACE